MPSPLPFEPETLDSIRKRLSKALERVYDSSVPPEDQQTPETVAALNRTHVFDYDEGGVGVRMIVSVVSESPSEKLCHFSFSKNRLGKPCNRHLANHLLCLLVKNGTPVSLLFSRAALHMFFRLENFELIPPAKTVNGLTFDPAEGTWSGAV